MFSKCRITTRCHKQTKFSRAFGNNIGASRLLGFSTKFTRGKRRYPFVYCGRDNAKSICMLMRSMIHCHVGWSWAKWSSAGKLINLPPPRVTITLSAYLLRGASVRERVTWVERKQANIAYAIDQSLILEPSFASWRVFPFSFERIFDQHSQHILILNLHWILVTFIFIELQFHFYKKKTGERDFTENRSEFVIRKEKKERKKEEETREKWNVKWELTTEISFVLIGQVLCQYWLVNDKLLSRPDIYY